LNENKYLIEYAIELQNKNRKLMKQKAILIKKQKSVIIDLISWLTGGPGDWEIQ